MVEAYFEKINPAFGHNTGVVVIIGILCSYAIFLKAKSSGDTTVLKNLQFD